MDYQPLMNVSKEYMNCNGYDGYNISLITDPQVVYQVQGSTSLPENDDGQPSIILDMSNNVKIESLINKTCDDIPQLLHQCVHCNMNFNLQSELENHYLYCTMRKVQFQDDCISISPTRYVCDTKSDSMDPIFDDNLAPRSDDNSCKICLKVFKSRELLKKHLDRTLNEGPVNCNLCSRVLHGPSGYLRHLKTHYGKSCEVCSECGKRFTSSKALRKHEEVHKKNVSTKVPDGTAKSKPEGGNCCNVCGRTFVSKEKLEKHLKAREGDVPIKCTMCQRTLHSSGYEYHLKAHSALKYSCAVCAIKFVSLHELKEHKSVVHGDYKQFVCEICKKSFKYNTGLKLHLRLHTGETPYSCDMCHMKFPFSSNLKYHKRIHSQDGSTLCRVCNVSFPNLRELSTHNRVHQGEKIYKCSCGKLFRLLNSLVIHQKNNKSRCVESTQVCDTSQVASTAAQLTSEANKYSCDKCNRSFHTSKALEKHTKRRIHTASKVEPVCAVCGKCFQTMRQVKKHEAVHAPHAGSHHCTDCGQSFSHVDSLNTHFCIKTQDPSQQHPCDVCGKAFSNTINLKKHIRNHTGQRPYVCNTCFASFADRSTLNDHRVVHSDARNHKCSDCGKGFKSSRVLKIHSRVHQPDRPYKCNMCTNSFKHLGTLISHKVTHTGVKAHQCRICWMKFSYAKGLKRHYKVHNQKQVVQESQHRITSDR